MVTYHNPETVVIRTEGGAGLRLADIFHVDVPAWMDRALCAQTDPQLFFPESSANPNEAKRICSSCPVQTECLTYAIEQNDPNGVWGGLGPRERKRLRKTRPCQVCEGPIPWAGHATPKCCSDECREQARRASSARYDAKRRHPNQIAQEAS
jgi:hypothetical protein